MQRGKILVVDDEKQLVEVLQLRLEAAGFKVTIANDGMEGLEKVRKERFDLILLDLMLPKIDGYKLCRMLKFDVKYKDIPIIILSARAQETDKNMAKEVGADDYLCKPYDAKVLMEKIEGLVKP